MQYAALGREVVLVLDQHNGCRLRVDAHDRRLATRSRRRIESLTRAWEDALANHDLEALLACYADDAVLESPVAAHILGGRGVCRATTSCGPSSLKWSDAPPRAEA